MRSLDVYTFDYYDILWRLLHGETQKSIAKRNGQNKSSISRKVKNLINLGLLKEEQRDCIKIYMKTPGTEAYLDKCYEKFGLEPNTGGIDPGVGLHESELHRTGFNLSTPGVEHVIGALPCLHHVQYTIRLHYKSIREGFWGLPNFPYEIKKHWTTKGNTNHWLMLVNSPEWSDDITVHYTHSLKATDDSLQISMPCSYILKDWLVNYPSVEKFFDAKALEVAAPFQGGGYELGELKLNGSIEFAHPLSVFDSIEDLKAMRISKTLHIDFSKGKAEMETKDPTESLKIREAALAFLNLPTMERAILGHQLQIKQGVLDLERAKETLSSIEARISNLQNFRETVLSKIDELFKFKARATTTIFNTLSKVEDQVSKVEALAKFFHVVPKNIEAGVNEAQALTGKGN